MALENIRTKNCLSPITKNPIQKLAGQKGGEERKQTNLRIKVQKVLYKVKTLSNPKIREGG